jgi:hydroxymethylbilane synthase
MAQKTIRIGTRDSQLAVWQATLVQGLLKEKGVASEMVYIKSEGDLDTTTPLYELGVQGVFTKALDAALLNNRIDIAVHSMKDVPTQLAQGIIQAAVLKRASYKDLLVYKNHPDFLDDSTAPATVATSSVRRIAQWLHRYPNHSIDNLRGNVNTRLRKLEESNWHGAIFAAAGLDRIDLRPENSIELDWMLPAPAQGAIMIVCRKDDTTSFIPLQSFNDSDTVLCTKIERDFLRTLMGGCSTPISALAQVKNGSVYFEGNIISTDGKLKAETSSDVPVKDAADLGVKAATDLLTTGGQAIIDEIRKTGLTNE